MGKRTPRHNTARRRITNPQALMVICLAILIGIAVNLGIRTAIANSPTSTTAVTHLSTPPAGGKPPHVMVFMMENQGYGDIIGNTDAPYLNTLAKNYQTFTNSHAVAHNSLPNYLAAITGSYYPWSAQDGDGNDCSPSASCRIPAGTTTLGDQLDTAGISWGAFMGGMPDNCGASDAGGSGGYVVHHDPFMYEPALAARDCAKIQPADAMLPALNAAAPPAFAWYSPAICNDAGGDAGCSTISAGDDHVASLIPAIQSSKWYKNGGVIVLSFDEGNDDSGQHGDTGGHVLTTIISAKTAHSANSSNYINTYGLLHSIENAYGLGCLASACKPTSGLFSL